MKMESMTYLITLPLIPSRQGRENELLDTLFIPSREFGIELFDLKPAK